MASSPVIADVAEARAETQAFWNLRPGDAFGGHYVVREKIAEGAYSAVYRADSAIDGEPVALKILDPLRAADPVGRMRFEREFEILQRLSHVGIARCHRRFNDRGLDVLVLEYIEGETLGDRLLRSRLEIDEAVSVAERLLDALSACHSQGIIHRDLKPANIILHPERGPVILDFGVAWFTTALNLTRTGAVVGSPQYLAPEVFGSSLTDERADLYAIGAILFEMLTGRTVHLADSVAELAVAHASETPPSVSALRPEVELELARVVARAIAVQPEDRFATGGEFRDALVRGGVIAGRALRARIRCPSCQTALIITLPFCPGCGRETNWEPTPGPFAVQLTHIEDASKCLSWLQGRYGRMLRTRLVWIEQRLQHVPVPLILNASQTTAEQLVAEAHDIGCTAEIVRARAIVGARIRAAKATPVQVIVTIALHFLVVMTLGVLFTWLWITPWTLALPTFIALVGAAIAARYVRRPVLVHRKQPAAKGSSTSERVQSIRAALTKLQQAHARKLAASAVARAAPVLLGDVDGLASGAVDDTLDALDRAVAAAGEVDTQASVILTKPRARIAVDMDAARLRIDKGEERAIERLRALEAERDELAEASVAHDLAARQSLQACADITSALATRTAWQKVIRS